MTREQYNQKQTGLSVTATFSQFVDDWENDPILTEIVNIHNANMADITHWENKQKQSMEFKGMTSDKNLMREFIIPQSVKAIGAIRSLAAQTNNAALGTSVNFSESSLKTMGVMRFIGACDTLIRVMGEQGDALVPFGLSSQFQTDFATEVSTFTTMCSVRRVKQGETKHATQMLKEAISRMRNFICTTLAYNMVKYKPSTFYSAFISSTKIIDLGENGTGVKGTITNTNTEQKIKNAIVELVELGRIKTTDRTGYFSFKRLDMANCTIRVRAIGYDTMEIPVALIKGKLKDADFAMTPSVTAPTPVNA